MRNILQETFKLKCIDYKFIKLVNIGVFLILLFVRSDDMPNQKAYCHLDFYKYTCTARTHHSI